MRALFLTLLCLSGCGLLQAQKTGYQPMTYSTDIRSMKKAEYIRQLAPKYISSDKKYIADWNNYLYDIYRTYNNASGEQQFITEPYVVRYLQSVLQSILDANGIRERIQVVCTRYQEANAYNIGDNRLYVNIGVLKLLDNEAQLAFLLSHELSHHLLLHVQEKFRTARSLATDNKVKEELKDIRQARYNKLDRATEFARKYSYTFANYSRAKERAADSMAIVLLLKTRYDITEGESLMRLLAQSDSDSTVIHYDRFFSGSKGALRPELLTDNRYAISFGHQRAISLEEDSLKSHPDMPHRISFIERMRLMNGRDAAEKFPVSQSAFDSIKAAAAYEIIESYDANKRYAASVYHALSLLQEQPDNDYLIRKAAYAFKNVVEAVREHTIQNHVPIESEANAAAYNQLLRIIDRTTLDELTGLYQNFLDHYAARLSDAPGLKILQ